MTAHAVGAHREFLLRHLVAVLPVVALLLILERSPLDSVVSAWFFDAVSGRFPLRYHAAFETVTHLWAKYVVVLIGCSVIAAWFMSYILPALGERRRLLLFLSLALALAPAAVTFLKSGSPRHCPYDLIEFGGLEARLALFESALPGHSPGHCFPSGHASAGFCLLAFYFAGHALGRRGLALAGLWGGLGAGMLFGMTRVAQGAHFLSHNLWSGVVCWLVILLIYAAVMGPPKPTETAVAAGSG